VHHAGVCQCADVTQLTLLVGGNLAQHAAHDLAAACLGQTRGLWRGGGVQEAQGVAVSVSHVGGQEKVAVARQVAGATRCCSLLCICEQTDMGALQLVIARGHTKCAHA
jgi:hypothetical protein